MNALKNLFSAVRAKVPNPGAGGAGSNFPKALGGLIVTLGAFGGIGYGAYHSMVTSKYSSDYCIMFIWFVDTVLLFIIIVVQPGHRGIIYSRLTGLSDETVMNEGLNFVIPWFQRVVDFDTRSRPQLIQSQSGSKGWFIGFVSQ